MQRTQDLEIQIMRELASPGSFRWNIRESYASMAKRLGIDEETVRRRVNRARESGFLKGWQIILNPHVLDRESAGVQLQVDDESRKSTVLSMIGSMDGVVILVNFNGRTFRVIFYYRDQDDLDWKVSEMTRLAGREQIVMWKGGLPESKVNLSRTDWEIIRALRKDPRRNPSILANEVGVSIRTIHRRLSVMTQARVFYLLPELNYDKHIGVAPDYLIFCKDETKKLEINRQLKERMDNIVFSFTEAPDFSIYAMICKNLSEMEEIGSWFRSRPGVEKVMVDTMRGNILPGNWLDKEIERHIPRRLVDSSRPLIF